jgi:hypothetical protein
MSKAATVTTASPIAWTGGELFDGTALCILSLPVLGAGQYPQAALKGENPKIRVPTHFPIRIKGGAYSAITKLWKTTSIAPPGAKYCAFFYDVNDVLVANGDSLFSVTADEHTLDPPTLTAPTAAGACILPESGTSGQVENTISTSAPTLEDVTGTKNGVNTAFTISTAGSVVLLYWNGQFLDEGVEYTRVGTAITMISPAIPLSGDSLQALIFA